ncbi:hypothetical protein MKP05_18600 [Halomonas sp. EGI 63088]|uniref:Valyl-tRNA synthetase modifier n=1 Tax=Halomonas flagellata TaxID=2920385 RepID=A0ABS9RZ61_9GAMM|nr:hypothetical protein [Halomonas flagellata]MCH4565111.1 hypothetical protein [Halomonas flagellata]
MKKVILSVFAWCAMTAQAGEVDDLIDDIVDAELTTSYCMLTNKDLINDEALHSSAVFSKYLQESKDWRWGQDPNRYVSRAAVIWASDSQSSMPLSERCENILNYGIHMQARSIEEKVRELKRNGILH